jgi:hypothetical protein
MDAAKSDVFIHDSPHTEQHMLWEYKNGWPDIAQSELLLSDDIFWNPAMHRFFRSLGLPYVQC